MSNIMELYVTEHEKRFSEIPPKDQNELCRVCGKPYWMHGAGGIECPDEEIVEP